MSQNKLKKQTTANAKKILRFLARRKDTLSPLLILTHDYPDPDTLASALALRHLAEAHYGIESRVVYGGIIGRMENREMVRLLRLPVHKLRPSNFRRYEHVALMDTQPGFQNNSFPKDRRATLVIDQHPYVKLPQADLVIIDTECGATSVMLAQALLLTKKEIPQTVATALAYGIISDTLNLYRTARPDVIDTYLKILNYADLKALARIQNPTRSRRFFKTLEMGIHNSFTRSRLIVSHLGPVENPDLVSQIADFLLTFEGMNWSLCTGRFKGKLHVSLRSARTNVEAGEILRDVFVNRGDAGGHDTIAGGSVKVGNDLPDTVWDSAESELTARLCKRLRIPAKNPSRSPFSRK